MAEDKAMPSESSSSQSSHTIKIPYFQGRRSIRVRRSRSAPKELQLPIEIKDSEKNPSFFRRIHTSFWKVVLLLAAYLGIATICFYFVRNQMKGGKTNGVVDAVYFSTVTMTTVGYGDIVPSSVLTKLLACAFVFIGMALVALILNHAASYLVEKQEIMLVKALHITDNVGQDVIVANKAKYKCIVVISILLVMIVIGTVFLVKVEGFDFVDAFYCVCSTITTLGYGDKSFSTTGGRVFAVFWILTGTILLAQLFLSLAEMNTERRQRELAKWVLDRKMTRRDLEIADIDNDGVVGPAEFAIYKLKEMGKISHEDISVVMEEFDGLDFDQSGTLSGSDITLAQFSSRHS